MDTADIVIVGGGVVGSSIGYHLRQDGFAGRIVIVERDHTYRRASSNLAMGGIRQQFGSAVNIQMVRYSVGFYRDFDRRMRVGEREPHASFMQRGYLFLADEGSAPALERRYQLMRERGANVRHLSVDEIGAMLPDLRVDDLLFGVFGPEDGYANPKEVLNGFRAAAGAAGVEYLKDNLIGIQQDAGCVRGVTCQSAGRIDTPVIVNAAGPFAAVVGKLAGVDQPVCPMRQHLFRCDLPRLWPYRFPMVIDPGGVHWRHEDPPACAPIVPGWSWIRAASIGVRKTRPPRAFPTGSCWKRKSWTSRTERTSPAIHRGGWPTSIQTWCGACLH